MDFIQIEIFLQKFIAWNIGSDGEIKFDDMGTLSNTLISN